MYNTSINHDADNKREKTAKMSSGTKRDREGNARTGKGKQVVQGGRFQDMFAGFRDELDEHHDRRERIIKASRDVTAHSKKM